MVDILFTYTNRKKGTPPHTLGLYRQLKYAYAISMYNKITFYSYTEVKPQKMMHTSPWNNISKHI